MPAAVVNASGLVTQILDNCNAQAIKDNTPKGSQAVPCDSTVAPGYTWTAAGGFKAAVSTLTPALVEADLLAQVDSLRESYQMTLLTSGGAKKMIYNSKQGEATDYAGLGAAAVAALNLATRAARFPYATLESKLSGDTLAVVIARWQTAQAVNLAEVQRVEAIAITAKRRIKAATTVAAKQAAYTAIDWNWKPA